MQSSCDFNITPFGEYLSPVVSRLPGPQLWFLFFEEAACRFPGLAILRSLHAYYLACPAFGS